MLHGNVADHHLCGDAVKSFVSTLIQTCQKILEWKSGRLGQRRLADRQHGEGDEALRRGVPPAQTQEHRLPGTEVKLRLQAAVQQTEGW